MKKGVAFPAFISIGFIILMSHTFVLFLDNRASFDFDIGDNQFDFLEAAQGAETLQQSYDVAGKRALNDAIFNILGRGVWSGRHECGGLLDHPIWVTWVDRFVDTSCVPTMLNLTEQLSNDASRQFNKHTSNLRPEGMKGFEIFVEKEDETTIINGFSPNSIHRPIPCSVTESDVYIAMLGVIPKHTFEVKQTDKNCGAYIIRPRFREEVEFDLGLIESIGAIVVEAARTCGEDVQRERCLAKQFDEKIKPLGAWTQEKQEVGGAEHFLYSVILPNKHPVSDENIVLRFSIQMFPK